MNEQKQKLMAASRLMNAAKQRSAELQRGFAFAEQHRQLELRLSKTRRRRAGLIITGMMLLWIPCYWLLRFGFDTFVAAAVPTALIVFTACHLATSAPELDDTQRPD